MLHVLMAFVILDKNRSWILFTWTSWSNL